MRTIMTNAAVAFASVALTTGIVAFADPANASTRIEAAPSALVQIDDLDLRSDAGRSTAERRIHRAVDSVCGADDVRDFAASRCRNQASDSANAALEARIASR